ncbi:hypothetical protein ACVIEM_003986 [Rhizobium leguminosarum]
MPEGFDLGDVPVAEIGQRLLGKASGNADAHGAGRQLDEGETAGRIQPVEQVTDEAAHFCAAECVHAGDDLAETRLGERRAVEIPLIVPDKRDGFGEIADIVVGIAEQHLVHALEHQLTQHSGLDVAHLQRAGNGGKAIAAVRIGRVAEIVGQQLQLAVAAGCEHQAVEEVGEGFHGRLPTSEGF